MQDGGYRSRIFSLQRRKLWPEPKTSRRAPFLSSEPDTISYVFGLEFLCKSEKAERSGRMIHALPATPSSMTAIFAKSPISFFLASACGLSFCVTLSCTGMEFAMGQGSALDCEEGRVNCLCRSPGSVCDPGLVCIDTRCVDPKSSTTQARDRSTTPASSTPAPTTAQEQGPDQGESSSGTVGSSSAEPLPEPEPQPSCTQDSDCDDQRECTKDRCLQGSCVHENQDGLACNDKNPCTAKDKCSAGICVGRPTVVLSESFSRLPERWKARLGAIRDGQFEEKSKASQWEIGAAKASECGAQSRPELGEDPAQDHSPGEDNALAGVVIGGCHQLDRRKHDQGLWDCLFSPSFETGFFDTRPRFSYMRHLNAPPKRMRRRLGVEHRIVLRLEDDSIVSILSGFDGTIRDKDWKKVAKGFDKQEGSISLGFCFRRGYSYDFPGWSIDDVRVAQQGCEAIRPK